MITRSANADRIARRYFRAREGNVIAFPGIMAHDLIRGEYRWHCPFPGCYRAGRRAKRFSTALRGLDRHVEERHR